MNLDGLDDFARGYLECAEWCGLDEEQREAFELSVAPRWDGNALIIARHHAMEFQRDNAADLDSCDLARAGHDFWLTRNRHGAGFWDGGYADDVGKRLTDAAHAYGEASVYFDANDETLSFD